MNKEFWRGKKVLVTGHTGFKGAWLSLWLSQLGARVYGFSLPAEPLSLYHLVNIKADLESEFLGDITHFETFRTFIQSTQPDIILHLAAQSLVHKSYREPLSTFETNIMGTAHLLESGRGLSNLKSIVVVTTDKVYENKEQGQAFKESDPVGGHDPYSTSKACAELITASYIKSFIQKNEKFNVATARAGNVIGGGDFCENRLVPDLVRALKNSTLLEIRSPQSIRPWQHVLEPLSGYLELAEKLAYDSHVSGAWNFGPHTEAERSVHEVVKILQKFFPILQVEIITTKPSLHEAQTLKLDIAKATSNLAWKPRLDFEQTIQWCASWYQNYLVRKMDLKQMTLDQISAYEAL